MAIPRSVERITALPAILQESAAGAIGLTGADAADSASLIGRLASAQVDPAGVFDNRAVSPVGTLALGDAATALLDYLSPFSGEPGPVLALEAHPLPKFLNNATVVLANPRALPIQLHPLAKTLGRLRGVALSSDDHFLRQRMRAHDGGRTIDLMDGWLGSAGALIELHLALLRHPALTQDALRTLAMLLEIGGSVREGKRIFEPEATQALMTAFESAYFRMPAHESFVSDFLPALKRSSRTEPKRFIELIARYLRHAAVRDEHVDLIAPLEIHVFKGDKRFYTPELILALADAALRRAPTLDRAFAKHITKVRFDTLRRWAEGLDAGPERDRLLAELSDKFGGIFDGAGANPSISIAPTPRLIERTYPVRKKLVAVQQIEGVYAVHNAAVHESGAALGQGQAAFKSAGWRFFDAAANGCTDLKSCRQKLGPSVGSVFLDRQGRVMVDSHQVSVRFAKGLDEKDVVAAMEKAGFTIVNKLGFAPNLFIVRTPVELDSIAGAQRLAALDGLLYAQPELMQKIGGRSS